MRRKLCGLCNRRAFHIGRASGRKVPTMSYGRPQGEKRTDFAKRMRWLADMYGPMYGVSDDTWVYVHLNVDGIDRVSLFVTIGIQTTVKTISTNLPDDEEMCFAFGCRNGQAEANAMSVGFSFVLQDE